VYVHHEQVELSPGCRGCRRRSLTAAASAALDPSGLPVVVTANDKAVEALGFRFTR